MDFIAALQKQANASCNTIRDLCQYCTEGGEDVLNSIAHDNLECRTIKNQNLHELLDVFITPYDRESIYRIVNQLAWVALSVKHLSIILQAFKVNCPDSYQPIITTLKQMAVTLSEGFSFLATKNLHEVARVVSEIAVNYDKTVEQCEIAAARHLQDDEVKVYLRQHEILTQLKEVAKRIHVSANSLEDMAIKIV